MKITLITATYNRTEEIRFLLESLNNQTSKDFELIIVDQNKDDRIRKFLKGFRQSFVLRYYHIDEIGLSKARNYGLGKASYDIAGFPDDDCRYENDLIEKLINIFHSNSSLDCAVAKNTKRKDKLNHDYYIKRDDIDDFHINYDSYQIFLRRSLFNEIGFFDEKLGLSNWFGCGEETDIMIKLIRKGGIAFFSPDLKVFHSTRIKKAKLMDYENIRKRSRGTGALWKKHNFKKSVIARGLISPIIRILFNFYNLNKIRYFWNIFRGRIEGYRYWN